MLPLHGEEVVVVNSHYMCVDTVIIFSISDVLLVMIKKKTITSGKNGCI